MAFNCCNAAAIFMLFFTCVSSHNVVPCPPKTTPSMPPSVAAKCPKDTLKFGVCGSWLGLAHEANALGAKVKIPIAISLLINVPQGFACP
ncbi:hypothetical protein GOBAR_DD02808 [Gossypium barbadense]|nr:hypothetical protein GOBAR_DD02808 [Gossypium barbadense]